MVILGLTGSIGMGKSTAAGMFRLLGIPVHDADATVHALLARGGAAVPAVEASFPGVVRAGAVERPLLGARVFGDRQALRRLEAILHPLVRQSSTAFLRQAARRQEPLVVLDIPLLFETGGERLCDAVVVVSAPVFLQRQRVLRRPGMTAARLEAIMAQQITDREKRRRADYVVNTGLDKHHTLMQIGDVATLAKQLPARSWPLRRKPPFVGSLRWGESDARDRSRHRDDGS
jgi:dephospho-CoA kinase